MSPKAIAVAGLSAIAVAASGCGGDSDPEAEFRAAFEKEFSAAPWYPHITGIEVADESDRPHIKVTTDLGPENNRNRARAYDLLGSYQLRFRVRRGRRNSRGHGDRL